MSYRSAARASTDFATRDRSAISRTLTPLRFSTLLELDARFADFLRHAERAWKHSLDSRRGYKGTYANFRTFLGADTRPLAEKLCDIDGWIAWNQDRDNSRGGKLSDVTVNTYFRQLRPFFQDLEERDGLRSPFRGIHPPKITAGLKKARTPEECDHILRTAEHMVWPSAFERWRAVAIIATFLYAGLRKSELLRLDFNDVDLSHRMMVVNAKKTRDERKVPINDELLPILERYVKERKGVFGGEAGASFFTSLSTAQGISESTLRRIVSRIRRVSGVPFSMHSLRHSFITRWLNSDGELHVVQVAAGHKRITTTAGYVRVRDEDLQREMQKLSFRMRAARRT